MPFVGLTLEILSLRDIMTRMMLDQPNGSEGVALVQNTIACCSLVFITMRVLPYVISCPLPFCGCFHTLQKSVHYLRAVFVCATSLFPCEGGCLCMILGRYSTRQEVNC